MSSGRVSSAPTAPSAALSLFTASGTNREVSGGLHELSEDADLRVDEELSTALSAPHTCPAELDMIAQALRCKCKRVSKYTQR